MMNAPKTTKNQPEIQRRRLENMEFTSEV